MDLLLLIVSCLITFMYFISGVGKIRKYNVTVGLLQNRFKKMVTTQNMPLWFFQLAIIGVIVLQICGPAIIALYVIIKNRCNRELSTFKEPLRIMSVVACILLIIFTITATYLFHFPPSGNNYYATLSNINACGGLLLLGYFFIINKNY